jgi:hypothetical protein
MSNKDPRGPTLRNYPVFGRPEDGPYVCPCGGHVTLAERGGVEICPVCFWEDDGQDDPDADIVLGGPNGQLSLTQPRQNFAAYGAATNDAARSFVCRYERGAAVLTRPHGSPSATDPCTWGRADDGGGVQAPGPRPNQPLPAKTSNLEVRTRYQGN